MKNTVVVNLFGGPGTGKSTNAARLFTMMKDAGMSVELVNEFAKDLVWEDRINTLGNQFYVSAKQHHKMFKLLGKVDFIITDSPFIQSTVYCNCESLNTYIKEENGNFNNLNFFLERVKDFKEEGRLQTEQEAIMIDQKIYQMLEDYKEPFNKVEGSEKGVSQIFEIVKSLKLED